MIVLASESPRRRELLGLLLPRFEVQASGFEEEGVTAESPAALSAVLAEGKAKEVWQARQGRDTVIGCDTVVDLGGRVLGKPSNRGEAADMLRALSGKRHFVHTGVQIFFADKSRQPLGFVSTTAVWFDDIPEAEIETYIGTKEPYDKAGGYGIQGWAARFVPKIEGCYYNVMGLPVAQLYRALRDAGALSPE